MKLMETGDVATGCQSTLLFNEPLADYTPLMSTNEYNCGSVFRNPPGAFSASLTESCGLKGFSIGGGYFSKQAHFIINQSAASVADIEAFIYLVQTKVREQTTIEMIHEVHIIGGC